MNSGLDGVSREDLVAKYAGSDDLIVLGSLKGLTILASGLREAPSRLELQIPSEGPDPYDAFFLAIIVRHSLSSVIVARDDSALVISGSPAKLNDVADVIESLAGAPEEEIAELHLDYYPGHGFLSSSSVPLVVGRLHC